VDEAYRRQIALGVVGQLRPIEPDVRRNLQVVQEQRVAVGRRARDAAGSDDGVATAHVLDHKGLAELRAEPRREHARNLVSRPAGGKGHDDGDGLRRIVLSKRHDTPQREQKSHRHLPGMIGSSTYGILPAAKCSVLRPPKMRVGRSRGSVCVKGPTPFIGYGALATPASVPSYS